MRKNLSLLQLHTPIYSPQTATSPLALALLTTLLLVSAPALAGILRTIDGKTLQGQLLLEEPGQITIRNPAGQSLHINLHNVFSAYFPSQTPQPPPPPTPRWNARDFAHSPNPGSVHFNGQTAVIRASGNDLAASTDSGYLVHQPLEGDGQIIARVSALQQSHPLAAAALVIRAGADAPATGAMILVFARGGGRFQSRTAIGEKPKITDCPRMTLPCWLKLVRKNNTLTGFFSPDGQLWESVGSQEITLPSTAQVGLAVNSHNNAAICTATFEYPRVLPAYTKPASSLLYAGTPKGILLRRGSILAGQVNSANDSVLKLARDRELSIPLADVAHIYFSRLKPQTLHKIKPGQKGVLLTNGDFFLGNLVSIQDSNVKLSSVLFGLKQFETWRVAAVVLQDPSPSDTPYLLHLTDGSMLLADRLSIEKNALSAQAQSLPNLRFSPDRITEIRPGRTRCLPLSDLKPASIQTDRPNASQSDCFAFDETLGGEPIFLAGQPCPRGIALAAGTTVTFRLNPQAISFAFRAAIPDNTPTPGRAIFVVRADEKEIYRSPERTPAEQPLFVCLPLSGTTSLSLRVESASTPASGLFADPCIIK